MEQGGAAAGRQASVVAALIDSHCHLDAAEFDADRDAALARAAESGVAALVNPGVDLASSRTAVALAERYEYVYAAVGIHPHDAKTLDVATLHELTRLAASPRVVAIGEIGLDYYRDLSPRPVQREAFSLQLELAAELSLPVIIHDRDAHDDVLAMLAAWHAALAAAGSPLRERAGVLHSFSGDWALAERALALGFRIGVSGPVTYRNADRLRSVVRAVPDQRFLIETDAPYLPPYPHRGRRNEPAWVRLIAEAVAGVRGVSVEQIARSTSASAFDLFGWPGDRHR